MIMVKTGNELLSDDSKQILKLIAWDISWRGSARELWRQPQTGSN